MFNVVVYKRWKNARYHLKNYNESIQSQNIIDTNTLVSIFDVTQVIIGGI